MFEADPKRHLKLRHTRPDEARAAALADAVFYALALRGTPGHVPQMDSHPRTWLKRSAIKRDVRGA